MLTSSSPDQDQSGTYRVTASSLDLGGFNIGLTCFDFIIMHLCGMSLRHFFD